MPTPGWTFACYPIWLLYSSIAKRSQWFHDTRLAHKRLQGQSLTMVWWGMRNVRLYTKEVSISCTHIPSKGGEEASKVAGWAIVGNAWVCTVCCNNYRLYEMSNQFFYQGIKCKTHVHCQAIYNSLSSMLTQFLRNNLVLASIIL